MECSQIALLASITEFASLQHGACAGTPLAYHSQHMKLSTWNVNGIRAAMEKLPTRSQLTQALPQLGNPFYTPKA